MIGRTGAEFCAEIAGRGA